MVDSKPRSEETMMMTVPTRSASTAVLPDRPGARSWLTAVAATLALLLAALTTSVSEAEATTVPGIQEFSVNASSSQAGGHPNVGINFKVNTVEQSDGPCQLPECLVPRTFHTHFPTGFIGNPHVVPKCTLTEYNQQACPSDSQVGVVDVGGSLQEGLKLVVPMYNMETRPDQAGLLAFFVPLLSSPVFLELSGRTDSDYGLDAVSSAQIPLPVREVHAYLWGVPAADSHDFLRFVTPLKGVAGCFEQSAGPNPPFGDFPNCQAESGALGIGSTIPPLPYLQNPTTCGVPLTSTFDVKYWGGQEAHAEHQFPGMTGCQQMSFNPALTVEATTRAADTASGLDTVLKVPQPQSADTAAASELLTSRITLPEGFSINPNAADGKIACSDAETAVGTIFAATCPEFAKIGTITLDVAALPAPLPGAMYIAEPKPGDPYRILFTANGFATNVKLPGSVKPDRQTGQLQIEFDDVPQSPLQEFNIHIFGSERGLLATPTHCGTYPVLGEFVPWNSELTTRKSISYVSIDSGPNGEPCPNGARSFEPRLRSGTANSTAGSHAPFSLTLSRDDGDQNLTGVSVTTPPGFAATLKGVPYCPEEAIARLTGAGYTGKAEQGAPACPAASQVGTATTGAGAGSHPLYVPGRVYLAGPYKGAPLSLVVSVPAVSGPYDLGTVAVRVAISVDPVTARVTAVSDPLPQIVEGVLLRTRSILVNLDRPRFTLNPTNCDSFAVETTSFGREGAQASQRDHFQVANCSDLPFGPKLSFRLRGSTKRRGHPALRTVLRTEPGESNIGRVNVVMPSTLLLDNENIGTVCTRVQFAADACPAASVYGTATAETPLLDRPLSGPVYLRPSAHKLPDLVADLRGQFDIELSGRIDSVKKGGLRVRFESVPDAPVTKFVLDMIGGGSKGLLVNSEDLCKSPARAKVSLVGQNGATETRHTPLRSRCASSASRQKQKRANRSKAVR
jgi:hypothetical protein